MPLPDADGNDRGGIRLPEVAVPLGSYTGWNLRRAEVGAPDRLARWSGSFLPFSRRSLAARYASREAYRARVMAAAVELLGARLLLPADVAPITHRAAVLYERLVDQAPVDQSCAYQ